MKKERTMNNKGFSLVELIIVIAIMAILIGVMAPQLTKYVEQSRVSADTQVADSVRTAIVTALVDPTITDGSAPSTMAAAEKITSIDYTKQFGALVEDIMGDTAANVQGKLKSKAYMGADIMYQIKDNNQVEITITSKDTSVAPNLVVK